MQLIILKENLSKALTIVNRSISNKPQIPVLSSILLKTDKNFLIVSSTNLEIGIIIKTNAKIEKEGEAIIPGKLLTEFVNSLNAEKIEIILEGNKLFVKTNKTHASFATGNPSEFPPFP